MPRATINVLKLVGTVSLGLLTGVSYATSTQSLPALLALPSAGTASASLAAHKRSTTSHLRALLGVACVCYAGAFALAPRNGGRHPYLLITPLLAALGSLAVDTLGVPADVAGPPARAPQLHLHAEEEEGGYVDAAAQSRVLEVNGEEVRGAVERWRTAEAVRAGVSGLAFVMGTIGIWGDGRAM